MSIVDIGGPDADYIPGGAGDDSLRGSGGDDTLLGYGGNDTLSGEAGNDSVLGGAGDDRLSLGSGDDTADGGTGFDILSLPGERSQYSITTSTDGFIIQDLNTTRVGGNLGRDVVRNVELIRFSFSDYVLNTAPNPIVDLNGASEVIAENAANGTVVGFQASSVDPDGTAITYSLTNNDGGRFAINATTGVVTVADSSLINFEAGAVRTIVVAASDGRSTEETTVTINLTDVPEAPSPLSDRNTTVDSVAERARAGTLVGLTIIAYDPEGGTTRYSLANDAGGRFAIDPIMGVVTVAAAMLPDFEVSPSHTIVVRATDSGGLFADRSFTIPVVNRGSNNIYNGNFAADSYFANNSSFWTINGYGGNDTLQGGGLDDLVNGGDGNDRLGGFSGFDTLDGGAGDDVLNGGSGADSLIGGVGYDTVAFDAASGAVRASLTDASINGGDALGDVYLEIEALSGSSYSDTLVGNAGGNALTGLAGDDSLDGMAGIDTMVGGVGNDVYVVHEAGDVVTERANEGSDAVVSYLASYTLLANFEQLFGRLDTGQTLIGNSVANKLVGGKGNDLIDGGLAADTIEGGEGNDTLIGGESNDSLFGSQGRDTIWGGIGSDVTHGGEDDDLLGGDDGDDLTFAGSGNDVTFGWLGNDTAWGGIGNDVLWGDDGFDRLFGEDGMDTLIGGGDDDQLYGWVGADLLWGGGGDDLILGEQDNDVLLGEAGNDVLLGDEGNDTAYGWAGNDTLFGFTGSDFLLGEDGNDVILGEDDADFIGGQNGDDFLVGGRGADTLWGDGGGDTFVFNVNDLQNDVQDEVNSFGEITGNFDFLRFEGIAAASVIVTQSGNDTLITFAEGTASIRLTGFAAANLADQLLFA
jgi:Ca2+-binding RTX toxin-like protein